MAKIQYRELQRKTYQALGKELWQTMASAKNVEDLARFIEGALLPSEKVMLARRIRIAKKLLDETPPTTIQSELHVGQSTIETVKQWLFTAEESAKRMLKKS